MPNTYIIIDLKMRRNNINYNINFLKTSIPISCFINYKNQRQ